MKLVYIILLLLVGLAIKSQDQASLVAHYPFTGNADDLSGNENHGRVDGPTLTADRFGVADNAYEFNGEDDIIIVLDDAAQRLEGDFTIVAWVMPYSFKDHTILRKQSSANNFSAQSAYGIALSGTKNFIMNVATDVEPTGVSSESGFVNHYELNKWYRLIARKQDSVIYLTTNDIEEKSFKRVQRTIKGNIPYDSSPFLIGSRTRQQSNTFEGKIDDIKIYNRFMTLEEVTGLSFDDEDPEEEMEDDPNVENDNTDNDLVVDIEIIGDPWKFLLIRLQEKTSARVKLYEGDELVMDREFDSNIASVNIEDLAAGSYLLKVTTSTGSFEQEILIE